MYEYFYSRFVCILGIDVLDICGSIEDAIVKIMDKSFQVGLFDSIFPSVKRELQHNDKLKRHCDIFAGDTWAIFKHLIICCSFICLVF